jgi:hypothetical protein
LKIVVFKDATPFVPSSPILVTLMMEEISSSEKKGSYKSHMAPILVTLMMEKISSSETSVLIRVTRRRFLSP